MIYISLLLGYVPSHVSEAFKLAMIKPLLKKQSLAVLANYFRGTTNGWPKFAGPPVDPLAYVGNNFNKHEYKRRHSTVS